MKVKVLVTQLCLTLWPQGLWPRGSSVHGILQARRLEWVAFPSPGDLPNPGIKPRSPALQADSLPSEPPINYAVLCAMLSCSVMSDSLRPHGLYSSPGSSVHGDSPGKNTSVGCHALLQGIFPTQGSKPGLLHCRRIRYCLSHQGSPRILEWVAYPFLQGNLPNRRIEPGSPALPVDSLPAELPGSPW